MGLPLVHRSVKSAIDCLYVAALVIGTCKTSTQLNIQLDSQIVTRSRGSPTYQATISSLLAKQCRKAPVAVIGRGHLFIQTGTYKHEVVSAKIRNRRVQYHSLLNFFCSVHVLCSRSRVPTYWTSDRAMERQRRLFAARQGSCLGLLGVR
jgi:hypothetical protein